jgi:hypothetical protein
VVLAGLLVELVVVGMPLEGLLGAVPVVDSVVSGVGVGVCATGGEVARGGGQAGSSEFADNSRNCPMALSSVPVGSPA